MNEVNSSNGVNILASWVALEVLSPHAYKKIEDLAYNRDITLITVINEENKKFPWQNQQKPFQKGLKIFYQVIIGTINFNNAILTLIEKYQDKDFEFPTSESECIVASVTVDEHGLIVGNDSIVVSSFGWAIYQALNDKLICTKDWLVAEASIIKSLITILYNVDEKGLAIPLNIEIINKAYDFLKSALKIPQKAITNKIFTVKVKTFYKYAVSRRIEPPQPPLLNSFFLKDLAKAIHLIDTKSAPESLLKYLGLSKPQQRCDIFRDYLALQDTSSPKHIPSARWPSYKGNALVLLQQAAVNISATLDNDILAINGPPGTGKTTLLRDIIANLIASRAEMLAKFDNPIDAFIDSGRKLKLEQGSRTIYHLDESIKGFEMLITSSNNKAVENISIELPGIKTVNKEIDDLRYFNTISDQLVGQETWGLISAVLGNNTNRTNFYKNFWTDRDCGLSTYLKEAIGMPQIFNIKNEQGKIIGTRKPKVIENHNPPHNHVVALKRWQCAREDFLTKLAKSQAKLAKLQKMKEILEYLSNSRKNFENDDFQKKLIEHNKFRPNIISRLLRTLSARTWENKFEELLHCINLDEEANMFSTELEPHLVDSELFLKAHEQIHLVIPWCDIATQKLRDEVFVSAMKLHKAFIDAAAKPLYDNIAILMRNLCKQIDIDDEDTDNDNGATINSSDVLASLPDLWSSLFLIVPCLSSAFASVENMMKYLPKESLGWLLIDEAGQATPQAAVGAIMRAKNLVITGDPLQISPVVLLPKALIQSICQEFKVDMHVYSAPLASVQTLADSATKYFSEFNTSYGNRNVGFPLLVHRRCAEPMFSISNAIAYENLMVQAKNAENSPIRNCLGSSNWFNVEGRSIDKWCPEEGDFVLSLLRKLKIAEIYPDLYIVAPFKIVADNLRNTIIRSNIMNSWPQVTPNWTKERIGTIHTVQGREAEALIFVLGAPAPQQHGSRSWAGYSPNLLNVAVTRAKEVTYVVGNVNLWKNSGVFKELYNRIDTI
ncbi:MAG: hypothetical protein EOP33_00495 [Rickettsiaceae bacterium]|nr:MAG: hypothetical protein EOP33_00495 [Rickettsiaceae bacterium]